MGPRAGLGGRKISSPPGFDPRPHPARSQSLYRLSYPAHTASGTGHIFCAATSLQRGQASLDTLEGGSCTKNMTSTGGCSYSFVY